MRCHYDVLGIPMNASIDDIKKAYKKCALQWHPDKHPDNKEEANGKFLEVQDAYETLSNDQERAWYDSHREVLISGGKPGEPCDGNLFNIYPYFSSTCFRGFDDSEKGFYTIYRDMFSQLAEEDRPYYDEQEASSMPEFGQSDSDYETVVGPFYAFWGAYCTPRSFVWCEKHDTREAGDRYVRRIMDKENKKLRDKGKKERNEEIRKLVEFVRKKDKRVEQYRKCLEEKAQLAQKKAKEKKEADRARRAEQMKTYVAPEWSQVDKELAKLELEQKKREAKLAGIEYREEEEDDDDDTDEEGNDSTQDGQDEDANNIKQNENDDDFDDKDENELFCVACDKSFKSSKSFQNHEKSKKHKENIELLKKHMKEEDMSYLALNETQDKSNDATNDNQTTRTNKLSKKQKKNKRKQKNAAKEESQNSSSEEECDGDGKASSDVTKKETTDLEAKTLPVVDGIESPQSEATTTIDDQIKVKDKPTTTETTTTTNTEIPKVYKCSVCQFEFESRNKLFEHIKVEGHAIQKPINASSNEPLSHNAAKRNKRLAKTLNKK